LKRWRQSLERRNRNRSVKSKTRTILTKALFTLEDDVNAAEATVREAISALDRAAQKGVIHRNAASRSKSRLLKRFNLAQAGAVAAAASAPPAAADEKPAPRGRAASTGRGRAAKPAEDKKPAARGGSRSRAAAPKAEKPAPRARGRKTT
jgi:small subunit ribosomal protein S20